jgi:hypothetical protein
MHATLINSAQCLGSDASRTSPRLVTHQPGFAFVKTRQCCFHGLSAQALTTHYLLPYITYPFDKHHVTHAQTRQKSQSKRTTSHLIKVAIKTHSFPLRSMPCPNALLSLHKAHPRRDQLHGQKPDIKGPQDADQRCQSIRPPLPIAKAKQRKRITINYSAFGTGF